MAKTVSYIQTANAPWNVIHYGSIKKIFDDCHIGTVFFMPLGYEFDGASDQFGSFKDFTGNLTKLISHLIHTKPDIIYLQTSPQTQSEYLFPLLKGYFPDCSIWVEAYDISSLFNVEFLLRHNYDEETALAAQDAAKDIARRADAIIHKNEGEAWERFRKEYIKGSSYRWYPVLDDESFNMSYSNPTSHKTKEIILCGSIPSQIEFDENNEPTKEHVLLWLIKVLAEKAECKIKIFNPADRAKNSSRYEQLRNWLQQWYPIVEYSHYIPSDQLLLNIMNCDFGVFVEPLASNKSEDISQVSIPNRVATFIALGKPILAGDNLKNVNEYLEEFGAGIIIKYDEVQQFPEIVDQADVQSLTLGAENLRKHWENSNLSTLENLQSLQKDILITCS